MLGRNRGMVPRCHHRRQDSVKSKLRFVVNIDVSREVTEMLTIRFCHAIHV